ncbi:hypothetical protein [Endozoicomonas sp. SCSIO W0465]|uniref:hypothetical protein n=1 Tax=Endozoicomonas sp. SCSIO W0465 TaxID=2918516 RepID=UPI0020764A0E|nr:hypothetical protein [Endozoicomonas sp. SCSIO W0465]USE34762.1 hypothetical protein MJO57_21915 [Endozoicomonas sp. SCSIO W0465]
MQAQPDRNEGISRLVNTLKTAVAWGLVPLSSEIALNISKDYLKRNRYAFLLSLLAIHGSNIRRSTSQHLTDNLSARLESFSYKTLSDEHLKKQTDDLQTDLLFRSLFTFSILSMNAQKARKTYFRLQDILDNIASTARLALIDGDHDQASAMLALAAQTMVYIHPEARASDGADSIKTHFNYRIDWSGMPEFRTDLQRHLQSMDPLVRRSTLINLRYCDLLNQWQISYQDCSPYEKGAIAELEGMAIMAEKETEPGIIQSALKGIPEQHIRNSIFIMGVSVPAVILYFLNKKESPVIYTVVDHFAKVTGMATTKSTIERLSSNTRRSLENWGAIDTGKGSSSSPTGEFANHYFNTLQKNATAILAEQPNFARSNAQRALEALVVNLAEAFSLQRVNDNPASADLLAAALVQNYRENVEVTHDDSLIRSTLLAYRPLHNQELIPEVIEALKILEPEYKTKQKVRQWYQQQLAAWHRLSSPDSPEQDLPDFPDIPWISQVPLLPPGNQNPASSASWYQSYLPDKETISTMTIHGTALSYSILVAILEPLTIERLMAGQPSYWHLASYYLLASMFDFGLRSLGEPAIVHLQTVIKNGIGSTTGILSPEDKQIQDELANKVNVLNRKLSIEAQTSRSYRATLEALLTRYWSLSSHLLAHVEQYPQSQAAAMLALAAYTQRYFHAEFTEDNLVMKTLAVARLKSGFDLLREQGEIQNFTRQVFAALKALDPSLAKQDIRNIYLKILKSWGLNLEIQTLAESQDVLDTWASYGDYLLGAVGFSTQAMVKALVHGNEVISRSMANFFVNIFEYGTTDSLRKKIYAWSRLKMLNVVSFYPEEEMIGVNFANTEMTDSFRRQKFYFGKPELDMRTQLIQIITAIANGYYQAIIQIDADRQSDDVIDRGTLNNVENLLALTVLRLVLFAPDLAADDLYILQSISILSLPIRDELPPMREPIIAKIKTALDSLAVDDKSLIEDCMNKAMLIIDNWLQSPQESTFSDTVPE